MEKVVERPAPAARRLGRKAIALGATAASAAAVAVAAAPAEMPVVGATAADAACTYGYTYTDSHFPSDWSTHGFKTTGANCSYNVYSTYTALFDCWRGWFWNSNFTQYYASANQFCYGAASGTHTILTSVFSGNIIYYQSINHLSYNEGKF